MMRRNNMKSLIEAQQASEQRLLDAFCEFKERGGKEDFRKFKRMCEDGKIDLQKYRPSTQEQVDRRKALFKEAQVAGYTGTYTEWSKEMYQR